MRIAVSRDLAIPLVNQIHDQVAAAIAAGDLRPGDRLPTIRDLAQFLRINRNTVAQAYRLLEASGDVQTRAGGGTTVAAGPRAAGSSGSGSGSSREHELRKLVTSALQQAVERGFTAQEFGQLAYYQGQRWAGLPRVAVLVVHGYTEELDMLCQAVMSESGPAEVKGMLVAELASLPESERLDQLGEVDFALAPVRMLQQVIELLATAPFPVLGVGMGPSLATLVQVAKETSEEPKHVAVICSDPAGSTAMKDVLHAAGVATGEIRQAGVHESTLRETVAWADLVLVSDASAEAVAALGAGPKAVRFAPLVSDSSLATIRGYIEHVVQIKLRSLGDPPVRYLSY